MLRARVPCGILLALGGCVVAPPPGPAYVVVPAKGKDAAAFQQDAQTCQRAVLPPAGPPGAPPAAASSGYDVAYAQCMAAQGNTVRAVGGADPGDAYGYVGYPAYAYVYPDPYADAGLPFFGGYYGGWGGGWGHGWHGGGWRGGGWRGGGWRH
jgi:hypothetical protein